MTITVEIVSLMVGDEPAFQVRASLKCNGVRTTSVGNDASLENAIRSAQNAFLGALAHVCENVAFCEARAESERNAKQPQQHDQ